MKHWKTKEEMGEGFSFNEKEHEENFYNSLIKIRPEETNLMRTFYLIRDCWSFDKLKELKKYLDYQIWERENNEQRR